jgi:hypothetical protein
MPVITFDKDHLDEGFMFLARRGEVGCLPNDVFVVADTLFDLLKQSHIPFIPIENHRVKSKPLGTEPQGGMGAKTEKKRKTDRKV